MMVRIYKVEWKAWVYAHSDMRNSNVYLWCLQKVSSAPQIYFPQKMVNSFPNSEAELKNKGEKNPHPHHDNNVEC